NTDYSAGTAPLSGTKQTDPVTATKSVKLSCWGADGAVVTKSATIGVTPAQVSCTVYVCTDEYTPYLNESDCLAACAGWGECKAETSTKPAVCSGPVSLGNSAKNQTASAFNAFQSVKAPTVSKTQVASFSYVWNNDLQIGSSFSADVTALQTALTKEGVYTGELTGGYYDQTYISVKAFQQKYGINPTGYVGLQTRAKLNELY
ncbi:MAG: peptidoglycan-binding domain-containing protein, partial [Candidatus Paceibacterota bacterium]